MAAAVRDAQGKQGIGGASATTGIFATNPVTGDTMVVFQASISPTAPTDTQSNTYTQIGTSQAFDGASMVLSMWQSVNITGGASFTVTGHASNIQVLGAICLSGVLTAGPYNGDFKSASGISANPSNGASSPAPAANSIFLACQVSDSSMTGGINSPWTNIAAATFHSGASYVTMDCGWQIASTVLTASWTEPGALDEWGTCAASFAPVAAGRTTKNTHPWTLGINHGIGIGLPGGSIASGRIPIIGGRNSEYYTLDAEREQRSRIYHP